MISTSRNEILPEVLLSICVPSYNRPEWLRRGIESITGQPQEVASSIEIIVSDDSTETACRRVAETALSSHAGKSMYVHNEPSLGMAVNWNNAIRLSSGRFIHVLHDDDYLVTGALKEVVSTLRDSTRSAPVNLFGVNVVTQKMEVIRKQSFRRFHYLSPERALQRILSNPTFVRFPGMVIRRDVFENLGYFRPSLGSPADTEMWARLTARYGLACHPAMLANFTAHPDALTMEMFNSSVIETLVRIFDEVKDTGCIQPHRLDRWKSAFLHKFVLGGTCRYIKWRELDKASRTIQLFQHQAFAGVRVPLKWLPLRVALSLFFFLLPSHYMPAKPTHRDVAHRNAAFGARKEIIHSKDVR